MGPRPFGHGNFDIIDIVELARLASMGPRPFGHGNAGSVLVISGSPLASMGPRPFGHGNFELPGLKIFNYDMLQWGHVLSDMETPGTASRADATAVSFNGATSFRTWKRLVGSGMSRVPIVLLQWGHVLSDMETSA